MEFRIRVAITKPPFFMEFLCQVERPDEIRLGLSAPYRYWMIFTPFNLSIADLYNPEIAVGDCSDIKKAIYRLQSNSYQITSKYADPLGSAFEM